MSCSRTSRGVDDCTFNHSATICRLRSSWILVASSFALQNPLANLWIRIPIGRFVIISSYGVQQHASSTICSNCWFYATTSLRCRLSCSMFIRYPLSICTTRPSLGQSSVVALSWSWYKISRGSTTKFRPSPLIRPGTTLSSMLSVVSAPSESTTVVAILARNNFPRHRRRLPFPRVGVTPEVPVVVP